MHFFHLKILTLALMILFVGCSSSDGPAGPEESKSKENLLLELSLKAADNPGLSEDYVNSVLIGQVVYFTVPESWGDKKLVPTLKVSDKASVRIDGVMVEANDAVDLMKAQKLDVIAEDGTIRNYELLVRKGNVKVDGKVYDFMKTFHVPAVGLAISKDEEIVYAAGYGFAVPATRQRADERTLFRIASLSKQHTAIAVMQLAEQGKLSLDAPVFGKDGILSEEFGAVEGAKAAVTVRHLLQHTSGWTSSPEDPMFPNAGSPYDGKSLKERVRYVLDNVKQESSPGTLFSYYNLGYGILGMVIEKVSGMDYEFYLKEHVYKPAGIADIHVGGDKAHRRENEVVYEATGYAPYDNDMEMLKAAGGLVASARELMMLANCVDYGQKVPDILTKASLDEMYTPSSVANYGLGWYIGHSVFKDWASFHSGALACTGTIWSRGNNGIHGALLTNCQPFSSDYDTALFVLLHDLEKMFE